MSVASDTVAKVLQILHEEIVPAQGCTEPIAIALVAAKVRDVLGILPERVRIFVSGNIIKNVKSVVMPGSGGADRDTEKDRSLLSVSLIYDLARTIDLI